MSQYSLSGGKGYRLFLAILGGLTCLFPMGIDLYLPAMPTIAKEMGAPLDSIQMSLSVYTLSFSFGLLVFGPLSDKLGRKPSMSVGVWGYALTYLLTVWTKTAEQFIAVRMLQGIAGAAIMASIPAMVYDIFSGSKETCAKAMSSILLLTMVAPMVAPFIGGYLLKLWNWQSIFYFLSACGVLAIVLSSFLRETHSQHKRSQLSIVQLSQQYWKILKHRQALGCILANSLFLGGLFAFITSSPFVYIKLYGIKPENYGFLFALNIIAAMFGNMINIRLMKTVSLSGLIRLGSAIITLAGVLLLIAATIVQAAPLTMIVAPVVLFVGCMGFIGPNSNTLIMSYFPQFSGTANALAGVARFGIAGVASGLVSFFHDDSVLPMALVMAMCGAGSLLSSLLIKDKNASSEEKPPVFLMHAQNTPKTLTPGKDFAA